jgi:phosphomannomutase
MDTSEVAAAAEQWIEGDPDEATRTELQELIAQEAWDELTERMAGTLAFGTAGLRGEVAAGSNRMNRAVVIRTTRGLADYLIGFDPDSDRPVVIGRDARPSSQEFMLDAIGVLAAAGIRVRYFPEPTPTPLVAFTAKALGARAAIVITASHNPPRDNGYKVYAGNGAQIVPPVDRDIAAAIDGVGRAVDVPRIREPLGHDGLVSMVPNDMFDRYLEAVAETRTPPPAADLAIVHTPIHGVGGQFVVAALEHFGYRDVRVVTEQIEPDGRFPTVDFPNPEEPGALDLATALARTGGADVILANDPDTDRLAVSLPSPSGDWRSLTGNQIGVLLADHVLTHTDEAAPLVINSIVSSPMLADVAAHHGAAFAATLTGFKWIWNAALDLDAEGGRRFVFGYEEALGYSVGPVVRDKDGIGAAVAFADLMAFARANGETVWDRLAALYLRHGLWVSVQLSVVRPGTEGAAEIAAAMERLGADPPSQLAEFDVAEVTDYRRGAESRPRYLPAASLVGLDLGPAGRVLVRPSGTEPKLKIYVDLRSEVEDPSAIWAQEPQLIAQADDLAAAMADHLGLA